MNKLLTTVIVLASATPAFADDFAGASVSNLKNWIAEQKSHFGGDPKAELVASCQKAVADARKQNQPTLRDGALKYTVAESEKVCAEGAYYNLLLKDYNVFTDLIWDMRMLRTDLMPSDDFVAGALKKVDACNQGVDALVAAKIPATQPYPIKGEVQGGSTKVFATTVADIRPNICEAAKQAAAQFTKAAEEEGAKARAQYTKFGIKDDKLELMLSYGDGVFLPGGASSEDMKKYASASTLFVWLTSDPDDQDFVVHTVRRYQYKAPGLNKLVSQTEKTYRKKRGAKLGAAPFK